MLTSLKFAGSWALVGAILTASGAATALAQGGLPQGQSNSILGHCIAQLRQTNAMLKEADHDYGGHRAQAMKAVHAAVEQLRLAFKYEKLVKHHGGGAGKAGLAKGTMVPGAAAKAKLPQAESNAMLQEAIGQLGAAKTAMLAADHDYGGHRDAAIAAVNTAVTQLNTALQYATAHHK